ncbi:MAG: hypothetical protein Sapg2KO_43250 [Saprospiraceae bacterium]
MKNLKNQKFAQFLMLHELSERKKFKKHLRSSYPSSQQLHDLLDWFLPQTEEDLEKYTLEDLHKLFFSEESFDAKKISNLLSRLYLELRSFTINHNLSYYPALESIMFLDFLRRKNATELFSKEYKTLNRNYDIKPNLGHWDALFKMAGHYTRFYFPATSTSENEDLLYAWEYLQIYSEILNLKFSIAGLNRQALLGTTDLDPILNHPVLQVPIQTDNVFYPIIQSLRLLYKLYLDPNVEVYHQAKLHYFKYYEQLPLFDKNQILRYLLNVAIDQYKKGKLIFFLEVYEMFKFGLSSKALIHSNDLSSNNFINIIDIACLAKDYDFAKDFFEKHLSLTKPSEQTSNQLLGEALLAFSEKEYAFACHLLQRIHPENIFIKIKVFELRSRIQFEANDQEALFDTIEKFRGMISRAKNQGGEQLFLPYQNYLKMLVDLAKIPLLNQQKLTEKYHDYQPMSNNIWLNEQIQKRK